MWLNKALENCRQNTMSLPISRYRELLPFGFLHSSKALSRWIRELCSNFQPSWYKLSRSCRAKPGPAAPPCYPSSGFGTHKLRKAQRACTPFPSPAIAAGSGSLKQGWSSPGFCRRWVCSCRAQQETEEEQGSPKPAPRTGMAPPLPGAETGS